MIAEERRAHILETMYRPIPVRISSLSRDLGVCEMTIRRDLDRLQKEGLLRRTRGGAKLDLPPLDERPQRRPLPTLEEQPCKASKVGGLSASAGRAPTPCVDLGRECLGITVRLPLSLVFPEVYDDIICEGNTLAEVLADLCRQRSELRARIWRDEDRLWLGVSLNGEDLGSEAALAMPLRDGDELRLEPPTVGGERPLPPAESDPSPFGSSPTRSGPNSGACGASWSG